MSRGLGDAMTRPLALTTKQLALVAEAASALPPAARDGFLQGVAEHLGSEPTDVAVQTAIDIQLQLNRLPTFGCRNHRS
jgi:hypothetical protein